MFELAIEYFCLVCFLSLAAIQIGTNRGNFKGLVFFKSLKIGYILSGVAIIIGLAAFLTWNWRNPVGIIEGAQQFYLFMLGLLSAIFITITASSIINHSRFKSNQEPLENSFEALKHRTVFQAMLLRLRRLK